MNKKNFWVVAVVGLVVVFLLAICLILNDKFEALFFKAGLFEAGVKAKESKIETVKSNLYFEASNNSNSTITQVAGDFVINKTGEYSWTNESTWKEESKEENKYQLRFRSSEDNTPSDICILVESDADISNIEIEGFILSPKKGIVPLGEIYSNSSFAFECYERPGKDILINLDTKRESDYIVAIATTSSKINWLELEKYIIRRVR